jgi:uncharacterized membrane protein YjfL (UPF0719 family)
MYDSASLNPRFFWAFLLIVLLVVITGHCQTRVVAFPDKTILRRGNFIIAATTDGYLCYGTHTPLAASCHKAVPLPEVKEFVADCMPDYRQPDSMAVVCK